MMTTRSETEHVVVNLDVIVADLHRSSLENWQKGEGFVKYPSPDPRFDYHRAGTECRGENAVKPVVQLGWLHMMGIMQTLEEPKMTQQSWKDLKGYLARQMIVENKVADNNC
ncbi:uncharacterized protein PADG_05977 [Paracoccidioides brasiliensis Pb18]|uniref:Uncharacterized protein n=1 Tax=Paracoccidioides brasiliensis (strain Pb18) TaxID=502780 RepID=C1GFE1_PARBD|nr:uncharacterized protein PADG_05977 [Paracoccidioides brasiliensis Pb18]EEH49898.2 hypothetical protein PADG_05977 [Paracoccidioides brasiliensis Pb18]